MRVIQEANHTGFGHEEGNETARHKKRSVMRSACVTAYPDSTFSDSAFAIEPSFCKKQN
jgi:hypothetical protein